MTGGVMPLWRRMPKIGFSNAPFRTDYAIVNVGQLNRFPEDTTVTPELLREHGLVKQLAGRGVKILGDGELTRPLMVRADAFSRSAVSKIEAAGGAVEVIPGPVPPVRNKMRTPRAPEIPELPGEE